MLFSGLNIQDSYNEFLNVYNKVCSEHIPRKIERRGIKNLCKWLTPEIKKNIRKKFTLWNLNIKSGWKNTFLVDEYKKLKKLVKNQIKRSVREYEFSIASKAKENPKLVYEYFNSKKQIKSDIRALTDKLGKRREETKDIAEILNQQFKSVFEKDDGFKPLIKTQNAAYHDWNTSRDINTEIVIEKLKNLNEHKAYGVDNVCPAVLKKAAEAFSTPIVLLFRMSLDTGEVPSYWREANVSPIFKKGSKLEPANYLPVSLTSVVCRTLESILKTT